MRPEHLFAGVQKLLQRSGRSPDFASPTIGEVIHSGATARDSHPLPYSPRFYAGHLNVFERTTEPIKFRKNVARYHAAIAKVKNSCAPLSSPPPRCDRCGPQLRFRLNQRHN